MKAPIWNTLALAVDAVAFTIAVDAERKASLDVKVYGAGPPSDLHRPVSRICISDIPAPRAVRTKPARQDAARKGTSCICSSRIRTPALSFSMFARASMKSMVRAAPSAVLKAGSKARTGIPSSRALAL